MGNENIRIELGISSVIEKEINEYRKEWQGHADRMDASRIPRQILNYQEKLRRRIGRPWKR